ncbi:MAG: AIPR family protein [Chloroflexi bacterium]|nr:AIPR family protein [Chloroflexota bacterium]
MERKKNFAEFAKEIGQKWEQNEKQFNELYFKHLVAKAILFRFLDKNIMRQAWYGGYKANIVTYSITKLAYMVSSTRKRLDLEQIWKNQKLSPALESQLLLIAESVNEQIQDAPELITNVTEWCKKEACWQRIKDSQQVTLNQDLIIELLDVQEVLDRAKDAEKTQTIDNGIFSQKYVIEKGADYWKQVAQYGLKGKHLSPMEMEIIQIACKIPNKIPSEKQSQVIIKIENKVIAEGFFVE